MRPLGWMIGGLGLVAAGSLAGAQTNATEGTRPVVAAIRQQADVRFWGQINRAALYADNGTESEWFHVDNDSSPSRFGMAGDYRPAKESDWTFGGQIELGFKSDNSAEVVFGGPDPEFDVDGRKIEAYAKSRKFGTLSAGQGDMASNGTAEEDSSGTYVADYSQVRFAAGSLVFGPGTNAPAVKKVFNNFDGLHRDDRVRYDAPTWGGITASVSAAGEDFYDVALRHSKELGGHKITSAAAYAHKGPGVDQWSGSCSILLGCGLNFTAALGGQNVEGAYSPLSAYGKLGYRFDVFSCGATCLAVDYARNEEIAQAEDLAESYAVALNQRVDPFSAELYATVRNYSLDRADEEFDDLWIFLSGVKLVF